MKKDSGKGTWSEFRGRIRKFFDDMKKESISQNKGKPFDCCHVPDNRKATDRKG